MDRPQKQVHFEQSTQQVCYEEEVQQCEQSEKVQEPCQSAQQVHDQVEVPFQQTPQKPCQQIQEQEPCDPQVQKVQEQVACEPQVQNIQEQIPREPQVQKVQEQVPCEPQVQHIQEQIPCEPQVQKVQEQVPCEPQVQKVQEQVACEPQIQKVQEQIPCEPQVQNIQQQVPCEPQVQKVQEQIPCEPQVQQIHEQKPCQQTQQHKEVPCQEVKPEKIAEKCDEKPCQQVPCKNEKVVQTPQQTAQEVCEQKAPIQIPCDQQAEPCKEPKKEPIKQVPSKQEPLIKSEKRKSEPQKAGKIVEAPVVLDEIHNIPTVVPFHPFNAKADAEMLHKAMKGLGTNEKVLIDILCRRTCDQRVHIVQAFRQLYGKDLIAAIKKDTTGHLERVLVALCLSRADFLATEINFTFKSAKPDETTVAEILCSASHADIIAIKASYERLFGHSLAADIEKRFTGGPQMFLISILEEPHSLDHKVPYDVDPELQAIRKFAEKRAAYLANRVHESIKGLGTKDRMLIRVIVSRCDVDLGNIKIAFENIYGKPLATCVATDVSFNYKKTLLTLIG